MPTRSEKTQPSKAKPKAAKTKALRVARPAEAKKRKVEASGSEGARKKLGARGSAGARKKLEARGSTGARKEVGASGVSRARKEAVPAGAVERTRTASKVGKAKEPAGAVAQRLAQYRSMRDFERTPEPAGAPRARADRALSFVIQKHAASHLHYDFRLELDGVLLSWSVPKGPSLRPGDRRLAVRTEDHPLEYADFEGIIPKGEYGGGTVIVWDCGTWSSDEDARKAVEKGRLTFSLQGEKLRGRFHLTRTRMEGGKREHWLLFKGKDESADSASDVVIERPESALTGRTIEEVAAQPERVWHSNREPKPAKGANTKRAASKPELRERSPAQAADTPDLLALVKRLPLPFGLTNLDKVLYPDVQLLKGELIAYYASVASFALPHLGGRPLMLMRCPHGAGKKCFFQKHANEGVPAVVQRTKVDTEGELEEHMTVRDLNGLVALAQIGALEIHTWTCHIDHLESPDQLVFDIDPDEGLGWDLVVETALRFRARLRELGLQSFVKTTGGKGLHVALPVTRKLDWEQHKSFAKAVAESLARERPDRYLTNMSKAQRKGRLFLDYLRNGRGATAIAPYSTRARTGATVATPISWEELERGVNPKDFTVYTVTRRLGQLKEDPWKDYANVKQSIGASQLRAVGMRK
jgi:bifunctional non-homologous end joining protein LigD